MIWRKEGERHLKVTSEGTNLATTAARRKKKAASHRIMERVAEAFGVMMLDTGLFQADAHPGNILVMKGALHAGRS